MLLGLLVVALVPLGLRAQERTHPPDVSFGYISGMMGSGTSLQRGERPSHSTLGVAVGADFFHRRVIGTGQLRGKFLAQEPIRDPEFVCAERDCGPAHRLGLQADAYVDLVSVGSFAFGVSGGALVFEGTMSTMVVDHPSFEKSLWSGHVGPSVSWRADEAYFAVSPVMDFRRETTLADDAFTSMGGGITATFGWTGSGRVGAFANGRYLIHAESSTTAARFPHLYPEGGTDPGDVRVDRGVMVDGQVRLRVRVSSVSYLNVGGYLEISRSDLLFLSTGQAVPREFIDRGISLSFEFLQY